MSLRPEMEQVFKDLSNALLTAANRRDEPEVARALDMILGACQPHKNLPSTDLYDICEYWQRRLGKLIDEPRPGDEVGNRIWDLILEAYGQVERRWSFMLDFMIRKHSKYAKKRGRPTKRESIRRKQERMEPYQKTAAIVEKIRVVQEEDRLGAELEAELERRGKWRPGRRGRVPKWWKNGKIVPIYKKRKWVPGGRGRPPKGYVAPPKEKPPGKWVEGGRGRPPKWFKDKQGSEYMTNLYDMLEGLRPQMAAAAQAIYDDWVPEEFDEYGGGGICDAVSDAMAEVIAAEIDDVSIDIGGQEGDDHSFLIVELRGERFSVDINPYIYERGGGYSWTKVPGVVFTSDIVVVQEV